MNRARRRRWSMLLLCAAAAAGGARSQDLAAARACAGIADKAARLACYDAAFAPIAPAAPAAPAATAAAAGAAPAAAPIRPAAAAAAPVAAEFGDNGQLRPQQRANLPKKLDFKVRSVASTARGMYRLTMENGQVWETKQADWTLDFKSGDAVTISRMMFDSYQISLTGRGTSVGVKRLQ